MIYNYLFHSSFSCCSCSFCLPLRTRYAPSTPRSNAAPILPPAASASPEEAATINTKKFKIANTIRIQPNVFILSSYFDMSVNSASFFSLKAAIIHPITPSAPPNNAAQLAPILRFLPIRAPITAPKIIANSTVA